MSRKVTPPPSQPVSAPSLGEAMLPAVSGTSSFFPYLFSFQFSSFSKGGFVHPPVSREALSLSYSKGSEGSLPQKTSKAEGPQPTSTHTSHLYKQKVPKKQ